MLPIVGVLLAAGSGSRFGSNKLLHPLKDGTPMAVAAARRLRSACDITIAVVRPDNDSLEELLRNEGLQVVVCDQAQLGMGHSLSAGVGASSNAGGWIVALADMPFIDSTTYQRVVASLRAGASVARPKTGGRKGHPVGFAAHWFDQLSTLSGDTGARSLLANSNEEVFHCTVDDPGIFRDIDTTDDL
ncbi:MAG: nucleotidyltransferase family protein [Pseudomonadota bacterium]